MIQRFSGIILSTTDDEIIALHRDDVKIIRDPGCYGIFGGAAENDESALETAIREINEETNLRPLPTDFELFKVYRQERDNLPEPAELSVFVLKDIDPNNLEVYEGQGIKILRDADDPKIAKDIKDAFADWFALHPFQN